MKTETYKVYTAQGSVKVRLLVGGSNRYRGFSGQGDLVVGIEDAKAAALNRNEVKPDPSFAPFDLSSEDARQSRIWHARRWKRIIT